MGVDPYLVIMWTSHRLIWDPGATFVSLTCRWRLCHIRMGGVESDKRKSCDRDGLVIGSLGAGRSLTPRARRPWSRRTGEINCPVRGIRIAGIEARDFDFEISPAEVRDLKQ